jgi:proteasome accessory factor C
VRKRFEPLLSAQKTSFASLRERVRILPVQSRSVDDALFRIVAEAVVRRKRLYLEHAKLDKDVAIKRTISPQTLVRYRDNWYVDGFCHLRNELRTFALNRISKAQLVPGKHRAVPRSERDAFFAAAYGIFTGPATRVARIRFTGVAAREVSCETWHPGQQGRWIDENTYYLQVPYGHSRELVMDILRWGDQAEVVEPAGLREEVRRVVEKMKKKYTK